MTMETLKDLKVLDEKGINMVMADDDRPMCIKGGNDEVDWALFDEMRDEFPICVDHNTDTVSFKLMTKPASEGGRGCQWYDMIKVALHTLKGLNVRCPSRYKDLTINKLEEVLKGQKKIY